jgi:hypothetical protein
MLVAGDRWQVWQDSGPCAMPLPAQTAAHAANTRAATAVVPVTPFPYGKFTPQALPGAATDPEALTVAFTDGFMQVYKHGALTHTDGMLVVGERWQVWQDSGPCATPQTIVGTYKWSYVDGVLSFTLVEDACPGRAEKVVATRMVPTP